MKLRLAQIVPKQSAILAEYSSYGIHGNHIVRSRYGSLLSVADVCRQ